MAYLAQPDDEEQKRQALAGQAPQTSTGAGVVTGAGGSSSPAAPAAPARANPTGYTNLQSYLAVNQPQGQRMAQTAVSSLGNGEGAAFRGNLQGTVDAFDRAAYAGGEGQFSYNGDDRGTPSTEELQREANLTYQGPTGLDVNTVGGLKDQAAQLGNDAKGLTSYSGLQGILQQQYGGKGGYTPGDSRLDSFLAGTAGAPTLKNAADSYADIGGQVDAAAKDASDYATQQAATTKQRASDANNSIPGGTDDTPLEPREAGNNGGQLAGQKAKGRYGGLGGYLNPNPYGYRSP